MDCGNGVFCELIKNELSDGTIVGKINFDEDDYNDVDQNFSKLKYKKLRNIKIISLIFVTNKGSLPKYFNHFRDLESIRISRYYIFEGRQKILKDIATLKELKKMYISNFNIIKIFEEKENIKENSQFFPKLQKVDLSSNNFEIFPIQLCYNNTIKKISMLQNPNMKLREEIITITNLKFLYISYCNIKEFPKYLFEIKSLKKLDISNNEIVKIPNFYDLCNLYKINFSNNKIIEIPKTFNNFYNLNKVNFSYNCIKNIPNVFLGMEFFYKINLSHNMIESIPKTFNSEDYFCVIKFSNNLIKNIHFNCFKNSLSYVYFNNNKIKNIHRNLFKCKNLTVLLLNNNKIEKIPIIHKKLHFLERFDISNNRISKINNSFFKNIIFEPRYSNIRFGNNKIKELNFSNNQIRKVFSFEKSTLAKNVDFSHNKIKKLNKNKFVEDLDLSHNLIKNF